MTDKGAPHDQADDGATVPEPRTDTPAAYPAQDDDDGKAIDLPGTGGTLRALFNLLSRSPFIDLHERAGEPGKHKMRGFVCFLLDFLVTLITTALILGIVAVVAWKTLSPVRWPW